MILKKYRKKIIIVFIMVVAALCFPAIITMSIHGKLPTRVYSAASSGKLISIELNGITETMDVEDFLPCAILGQLSIDNDDEFLKSFAVIMRTYIFSLMEKQDTDTLSASSLNIPFVTYDELEDLWADNFPDNYNRIMKIISETSLITIKYKGKYISPYYHSLSSGNTRSGAEVIGDDYAYLASVACPDDASSPNQIQYYYYTNNEFVEKVRSIDGGIFLDSLSPLENVQIVSRDKAGYVLELSINGVIIDGITFYESFNINSPYFVIEEYDDGVRITTYGIGHGLGVSLEYAAAMSHNGSSYQDILNYFYTNIEIKK